MAHQTNSDQRYRLNIDQVRAFLPHRAPFLLIDRVLEIQPLGDLRVIHGSADKVGTRVVALKNVTYNEPVFQGHFPDYSIFPGVLIIEAMAQTASFSLYPFLPIERAKDFQCILVGVDGARFRRPVIPGDTLRIESVLTKCRGKLWAFNVEVAVDGQKAAEAEILANLLLREDIQ